MSAQRRRLRDLMGPLGRGSTVDPTGGDASDDQLRTLGDLGRGGHLGDRHVRHPAEQTICFVRLCGWGLEYRYIMRSGW